MIFFFFNRDGLCGGLHCSADRFLALDVVRRVLRRKDLYEFDRSVRLASVFFDRFFDTKSNGTGKRGTFSSCGTRILPAYMVFPMTEGADTRIEARLREERLASIFPPGRTDIEGRILSEV